MAEWSVQYVEEEWDRLAVARAVAATVIAYRADHGLSQRALARQLGVPQPQVARIENAEHDPSHETMMRLSSRLGLEFNINIAPTDRQPRLVATRARPDQAAYRHGDAALRFSASGP